MLHKVRIDAQALSKENLIEALCNSWEARYRQRQLFMAIGREAGLSFSLTEEYPWQRPETAEDFEALLGYVPTDKEASEYLQRIWEDARMEIDMDEIVLTPDEESGE